MSSSGGSSEASAPPEGPGVVPITALPVPADGVPPVLSTPDEFADAARRLAAGTGPVAVDTERASGYRYSQRAYLIQLRRSGAGTVLVDPITAPDALAPVIDVLDGPEWVLHAADQDLPCLRELGFHCAQVYDTELGGRLLGLAKVNLAAMTEHFLHLGLRKGHGAADWSKRPLPPDWLNYAALDVEVLIELRDAIDSALVAAGKDRWAREEFEYVLHRPPAPPRTDRWRRTANVHTVKGNRALAIVRELWTARDRIAEQRDIAPGRVLPDSAIVTAATACPPSAGALTALPVFGGPRQRRLTRTWFDAIRRAQELPESELPPRRPASTGLPPINRWEQRNPDAAARAARVRPLIADLAEQHTLPAENLLAPDLVRRLCWDGVDPPITTAAVDARLAEGDARPWQRELCAGPVAAALAEIAANADGEDAGT